MISFRSSFWSGSIECCPVVTTRQSSESLIETHHVQVSGLLFIIITSLKLVQQVLHRTITLSFILQSYLSTILLFAGLYVLLYRIDEDSFDGLEPSTEKTEVLIAYVDFLTFSTGLMSAGTLLCFHSTSLNLINAIKE